MRIFSLEGLQKGQKQRRIAPGERLGTENDTISKIKKLKLGGHILAGKEAAQVLDGQTQHLVTVVLWIASSRHEAA